MPGQAAKVIITEKQQAILQGFAKSRSVSVSLAQRSKVILLAFEGHYNEAIEAVVGLQHDAVGKWRRRWRDNWHRLIEIECAEERCVLEREIQKLLSDQERSGRPPQIKSEQQAAIFKAACEEPKKTDSRSLIGQEASCATI